MIFIGQGNDRKAIVSDYARSHGIGKICVFGDELELSGFEVFHTSYGDSIMYSHYYKYLEFTQNDTLFVWNDCLKTTRQSELAYNCIRHCAEQTSHRLVFNEMPLISSREDFMILYTLLEPNPFVRAKFDDFEAFHNVDFGGFRMPAITPFEFVATDAQKERYQALKEATIKAVRRDANIIPRRLLKFAEGLARGDFDTKAELMSRDMRVSVSDLKVDRFFLERLMTIEKDIENVKDKVQQRG